jgi:hypothetical protein
LGASRRSSDAEIRFRRSDGAIEFQAGNVENASDFDENKFDDDDPYHRMFPLVQAGTAKYSVQIDSIAFDDGSVLPAK